MNKQGSINGAGLNTSDSGGLPTPHPKWWFMVTNVERICYDAEYDMWFSKHPDAEEYIFAPLLWIKSKFKELKGGK